MKQFDIHCSQLNIHRHHSLEASAGTGKTYSIEHLVIRLLIEEQDDRDPLKLSEILVVTFTRAATRELRSRIRQNLEKTLVYLQTKSQQAPDYLQTILKHSEEAATKAIRRLEKALATFEEARVFTIHSFCSKILRDYDDAIGATISDDDKPLNRQLVAELIKNYLRTDLRSICSPAQASILLSNSKDGSLNGLIERLASPCLQPLPIVKTDTFFMLLIKFQNLMRELKESFKIDVSFLKLDIEIYANCSIQFNRQNPKSLIPQMERFADLFAKSEWLNTDFDMLIRDNLIYSQLERSKRHKQELSLHYPELREALKPLEALVNQARSKDIIFSNVAAFCRDYVQRYLEEEELIGSDQLLSKTLCASQNQAFQRCVADRYRFAIIDEFQDTDPIQWQLLKRLFFSGSNMAIVGDPKQAIYSFRQADLNTYYEAVHSMPPEAKASLDINYRSSPEIVQGINAIFSDRDEKRLFTEPYRPIQAAAKGTQTSIQDGRGATHFVITEEKSHVLLPYVVQEIHSLSTQGCQYREIAVLVRDRNQAQEVADILKTHHIPAALERGGNVAHSQAYNSLMDLLNLAVTPKDSSLQLQCLCGLLIRMTLHEAKEWLATPQSLSMLYSWKERLFSSGVFAFFDAVMQSKIIADSSIMERLLMHEEGLMHYRDARQLIELLTEEQLSSHLSPQHLIHNLQHYKKLSIEDDERLRTRDDPAKDAVRIMTIHVSKGLEFRVVFAWGVTERSKIKDNLIPSEEKKQLISSAVAVEASLKHRLEMDAEQIRLAYVALTRAKERLYIPYILQPFPEAPGEASPIALAMHGHLKSDFSGFVRQFDPSVMTFEKVSGNMVLSTPPINKAPIPLNAPSKVFIQKNSQSIQSFTSLANKADSSILPIIPSVDLPKGKDAGIILHAILENATFNNVTEDWVTEQLKGTLLENHALQVFQMLNHIVNTPLLPAENTFTLSDLNVNHQLRELEFLFPINDAQRLGLEPIEGYIKGFIDLVCKHQDKYYVIDWKSNVLEEYSQASLKNAIIQHEYDLQARLYTEALRRYCSLCDSKPFEASFGGVLFLFLRGMRTDQPGSGVYRINPLEAMSC
jgi:exodeoxyribonuclease V beta subunit